tara:strand:+ start:234 stop:1289 length:1056 start_codon:yes stop_codon:yes gene_type:complete
MIYGANGYTGRLIVERAVKLGLKPTLAGRSGREVRSLARQYGLNFRVFACERDSINLQDIDLVLHCAGPFINTFYPMLQACIKSSCHYLDITGEIAVFEKCAQMSTQIKQSGIIVMPGVGFDVVPSDCLLSYVAEGVDDAEHLILGVHGRGPLSQGTMRTMVEGFLNKGAVRESEFLRLVPIAYRSSTLSFANRKRSCMTVPWGDVSTSFYSTGVPNIRVEFSCRATWIFLLRFFRPLGVLWGSNWCKSVLRKYIKTMARGPDRKQLQAEGCDMVAYALRSDGSGLRAYMQSVNGYQLTANAAIAAIESIAISDLAAGFYTPSKAFGWEFIQNIEGVKMGDCTEVFEPELI